MSRKNAKKTITEMNTAELAANTAEFDHDFIADTFGRPSSDASAQWEAARRKPGRPRRQSGVKVISVSVERTLLELADALADKMGISRARLIERGLKAMLAAEGEI